MNEASVLGKNKLLYFKIVRLEKEATFSVASELIVPSGYPAG